MTHFELQLKKADAAGRIAGKLKWLDQTWTSYSRHQIHNVIRECIALDKEVDEAMSEYFKEVIHVDETQSKIGEVVDAEWVQFEEKSQGVQEANG